MLAVRLLVAATVVAAFAAPAFAGEANGEPFPGPNAVVSENVQSPTYTMGSDAPFNYFYTGTPTQMTGYRAAAGASQDPYPFQSPGQVIQVQPAPRPAVVSGPQPNRHG